MSRDPRIASPLWDYFEKISRTRANCTLCGEVYSCRAPGNLKPHLRRKHYQAYLQVIEVQQQRLKEVIEKDNNKEVIHVLAEKPNSPYNTVPKTIADEEKSSNNRHSFFKRTKGLHKESVERKNKRLIDKLTTEKIELTATQKELLEKELEEKTIKVLLLQDEIDHRKHLYELEKQKMEHRREMQELAKEEMLLKMELMKYKLTNNRTIQDTDSTLPSKN